MRLFKVVPLLAFFIGAAAAQPTVTNVMNGASNVLQGLPNSGIAQGSIFIVTGTSLGPTPLVTAASPFQSSTLSDTSIAITVGSITVNALMYYTSAAQLGALLPSSTPTGAGTLIVTYQGTPSTAFAVQVVANNVGVFTVSEDGRGVAIATYPDYGLVSAVPGTGALADTCTSAGQVCADTYAGAAHPGDVVTLWATGLGPVSGGDGTGSLGQTSPVAMTLLIGGVSVPITYQGRSGCCIGEDQINFVVPSNVGESGGVPTGCAVPVMLQIGSLVSNTTEMPIAAAGRSCTPRNTGLSSANVQALTTATGTINFASAQLGRQLFSASSSGAFYDDFAQVTFAQLSVSYNNQPTQAQVLTSLDSPPPGTCVAYVAGSGGSTPLMTNTGGADPGAVTISTPLFGSLPLTNHGGTPTVYGSVLSGQGTYFSLGTYTLAGAGGRDIGKFSTSFTITQTPTWTGTDQSRLITAGVTRTQGMTINWINGSPAYDVAIVGASYTDGTGQTGATFACVVPSSLNTFTVPSSVLLALPAGPFSEVDFRPALPPQSFTASGLGVGILNFNYQTSAFPAFN